MSLQPGPLLVVFALAGSTLKLTDVTGERGGLPSYLFAGVSALFFGVLIAEDTFSSTIMFGIMVGAALSAKIDRPNLIFGVVTTLFVAWLLGFVPPRLWLLVAVSLSAFIDEIGHEKFGADKGPSAYFFRYRCALKLVIILLAVSLLLPTIYVVGFFCFDVAYDVTNWLLIRKS